MHESKIGHDAFKADRPRIATYVYVAALAQGDRSNTMANRQKHLRVAAANFGGDVVAEFSDASCKAKSDRPGFDALLARAGRERPFDKVMLDGLGSLARDTATALDRARALAEAGVEIISPQGVAQSMMDLLQHALVVECAQMDRDVRSRRSKAAYYARHGINDPRAHGQD